MYRLLLILLIVAGETRAAAFDDAQLAAREGRYRDVADILSAEITGGKLEPGNLVVAYSNRGIAYSLLGAYELARQDLLRANSIDPSHPLTLNHLGLLAEQVDEDYAEAFRWYQQAANGGFAASQVNLGNLYRSGKGTPVDKSAARRLYEMAAGQSYAAAYVPLGDMLLAGEGGPRDARLARQWFNRGAEAGIVGGHYLLGVVLADGVGGSANPVAAAQHLRVAAFQGHGDAQNRLGYLYRTGRGVSQSFLEAAKWYRLSADQGNVEAMNRLAWLLATCPVETVCNGPAAVALALEARKVSPGPSIDDSLAAAYARTGEFAMATAIMERLLSELPAGSSQRSRYAARLALYQSGQPYQLMSGS
ncbi:MAG: hypothetical protein ACFHX7_00355 [Pseudomonadota bacterium]